MKCLGKALWGHLRRDHVQWKPTLRPPQYYGSLISNIYSRTPNQGSDMPVICWSDYWRNVIMFVFSSHRISVVMKMLFFSKFWLNLYTIIEWMYFNLNSSFLVLQMGVITKWCNTKNWKNMEQYQWTNNSFANTKKNPFKRLSKSS